MEPEQQPVLSTGESYYTHLLRSEESRRTLGLCLSHSCPVRCAHCINSSLPGLTEPAGTSDLTNWITQVGHDGRYSVVNITGGEPFEHRETLCYAVQLLATNGITVTVVTSGIWATTAANATIRLTELMDKGLRALIVSTDHYHLRRVPITSVATALDTAHHLGLETAVSLTSGPGMAPYDALIDLVKRHVNAETFSALDIVRSSLVFAGRGYRLSQTIRRAHALSRSDPMTCNGTGPVIDEKGVVTACCGPNLPSTSPLVLGNLHDDSFSTCVDRYEAHPFIPMIETLGLRRLVAFASAEGFDELTELAEAADQDICNVCVSLLSRPTVVAFLSRLASRPDIRRELALSALFLRGDISHLRCQIDQRPQP